jgi:hypothetical protein
MMSIVVDAFKPVAAGVMRGFVDVTLPSGMKLHRCTVFAKDGRAWVGAPSKQIINRDGTVARDAAGKTRYEPTVSVVDRATQERWSDAVIAALKVSHPEALGTFAAADQQPRNLF